LNRIEQREEVDPARIAVLGYSMGSFHAALAARLDPRICTLVLSGGGDLDGNGGAWDSSSESMCQGRPYQALSFHPTRPILYALHQQAGETLVLNGAEDNLVVVPHHGPSFFADFNTRIVAIAGPGTPTIETIFYPGVGHRPSWIDLDAVSWLDARLHFLRWRNVPLASLGETHISEWAATTGARINQGSQTEKTEGGIHAVGQGFPGLTQAVPEDEWRGRENLYIWQSWARHTLLAQGLPANVPKPPSSGDTAVFSDAASQGTVALALDLSRALAKTRNFSVGFVGNLLTDRRFDVGLGH
jgi:hypothetical protein